MEKKIAEGEFVIYTTDKPKSERASTLDLLYSELAAINRKRYPDGLETGSAVTDTMWQATSLQAGVDCGVNQTTSGQYRSGNPQTKLENYIGEKAWQIKDYWINTPNIQISKIKQHLENIIVEAFKKDGRISIAQIYNAFKEEPYGFMPCNLTAFVMGFILKEYADGSYSWSDGLTNDILTIAKLKEMVDEIIKHNLTTIPRYKDKYIVTMTAEERAFNEASSKIFNIPLNLCNSVEQTRERITSPCEGFREEQGAALDPHKAHIVGVSFSISEGSAVYVPIAHKVSKNMEYSVFFPFITQLLRNNRILKIAHNLAFESSFFYGLDIVIAPPVYDTIIASMLTLKSNTEFRALIDSGLKTLVPELLGVELPKFEQVTAGGHFDELDANRIETVNYACSDSDYTLRLYNTFNAWFERYMPKHRVIVEQIESPTAIYVGAMKYNGLLVDKVLMLEKQAEAINRLTHLKEEIAFIIGDINLGANA